MTQLPAGATQERTQKVLDEVTKYYLENEKDKSEPSPEQPKEENK
jgi:multidrug efflux pump subunit AcrB